MKRRLRVLKVLFPDGVVNYVLQQIDEYELYGSSELTSVAEHAKGLQDISISFTLLHNIETRVGYIPRMYKPLTEKEQMSFWKHLIN